MAALTGIEVRCCRELPGVLIAMAVGTVLELDLEQRFLALGDVALRALQLGVPCFQGIRRGGVVLDCELRGLEAVHRVAGRALDTIGPLGKLAAVRVGLMAIHAFLESQWLLEVSRSVALAAVHGLVFAQQWIFGLGVVEALVYRCRGYLLPTAGVMAGLAGLRKTSTVRIAVAVRAVAEGNSRVAWLVVWPRSMALLAGNRSVQSSQGIASLGVVELAHVDGLPVVIGMALKTIRSQPSIVLILVAGDAVRRNTQEGPTEILDFDDWPLSRRYMLGGMATGADQSGVLAFKSVASLLVVECFRIPFDEGEVFTIVF